MHLQTLLVPLGLAAAPTPPHHHPTKRTEKSTLPRFLAWLTFLSLTSFIFHPDGMVWVVLHWAMQHTQRVLQHTVAVWGWDESILSLAVAGLTWVTTVGGAVATGRLYYVYIHPRRDATVAKCHTPKASFAATKANKKTKQPRAPSKKARSDQYFARLLTTNLSVPADLPPLEVVTPASSLATSTSLVLSAPPTAAAHIQRKPRSPSPSLLSVQPSCDRITPNSPTPSTSPMPLSLAVAAPHRPIRAAPVAPVSLAPVLESAPTVDVHEVLPAAVVDPASTLDAEAATLPPTLIAAPSDATIETLDDLSPACDDSPETPPPLSGAWQLEPSDEPILPAVDENDDEPNNESPQGVAEVHQPSVDSDVSNNQEDDELDSTPRPMTKADLMAFLRDSAVTASSIRSHVATGQIDATAALAIPSRDFADAKVPPLAVRMLFISAMAATSPQPQPPAKGASSVLPPPGFSAIPFKADTVKHEGKALPRSVSPQRSPIPAAKLVASAVVFPPPRDHHDNQYEREMERISNQMTMNVLD